MSDLNIPSEKLGELYGPMYKYYPRQWVRLIGNGAKEVGGTVELDLDILKNEWIKCYETKEISRTLSTMLMYIYCIWIKRYAGDISSTQAELTHDNITLMLSRFYTVKLNTSTINPVKCIMNFMEKIKKQAYWKLNAELKTGKNKFYQLRYNNNLKENALRHELMLDDEGETTYRINSWDFDWDWGNSLTDED